jgi:hypothetical protein
LEGNNYLLMNKTTELKSNEPLYILSKISKLSGTPAHCIRKYIDRGLIIPFKLDSKQHIFSRLDVRLQINDFYIYEAEYKLPILLK